MSDLEKAIASAKAYCQQDFEKNPNAYITAERAVLFVAVHSVPELAVGSVVHVRYWDTLPNPGHGGLRMPVFEVWNDDDDDLKACPAKLYAWVLAFSE